MAIFNSFLYVYQRVYRGSWLWTNHNEPIGGIYNSNDLGSRLRYLHRDKSDSLSHGSRKKIHRIAWCFERSPLVNTSKLLKRVFFFQMREPVMVEKRRALFLCLLVYMSISWKQFRSKGMAWDPRNIWLSIFLDLLFFTLPSPIIILKRLFTHPCNHIYIYTYIYLPYSTVGIAN